MFENRDVDRIEVKYFGVIIGTSWSKDHWDDESIYYGDFRATEASGLPDAENIEINSETGVVSVWEEDKVAATYSPVLPMVLKFSRD